LQLAGTSKVPLASPRYTLASGGLLLVGGRIGDLFGRKPTLIVGLLGLGAASAVGGMAQSFAVLAGARALQGALTQHLSWRWCLYVNLVLALPTAVATLALLQRQPRTARAGIDVPGTLTAVLGLFALVYGFNHAETNSWGSPATLGFLAAGVVLLAAFAAIERRAAQPLLPLRVALDRNRGGSYVAIGIVGVGMFGSFFFLTYYLQQTLGFSPIEAGVAFLPMISAVMATATASSSLLLPRRGPRPLVTLGMVLAAAGAALLTQLGAHSTYAVHVLPALIVTGLGLGFVMAPAMNTGTLGVRGADSGAASAMVNTMQQIGGSLGTALLSTLAASATDQLPRRQATERGRRRPGHRPWHTTAFWWAAAIFAAGAIACGLLLRGGPPEPEPDASPALAA
jgi:MFS family permease